MDYILKNKIEKIIDFEPKHSFAIKEGKVFYIKENTIIEGIDNQRNIYDFGNDYIILKDIRGNSSIVNVLNQKFYKVKKISSFSFPYLSHYEDINNERKYSILDFVSQKTLFETTEWIGRDIIDKYIFSDYNNIITNRNVLSGEILWQFDLSQLTAPTIFTHLYGKDEPYNVLKFIGILAGKLWVALNHYTIIAVDIKTSKLVYQLSKIKNFNYPFGRIIPAPESMKIDRDRNLLYALAWEYYWEINTQSGEIKMWNLFDYFQSLKLRNDLILNYIKVGEIIYFAGRNDGCNYESQIAGFDIINKKIVWQYKFQPDKKGKIPQVNDIKGNENILAIKEMNNTLQIFEKETK